MTEAHVSAAWIARAALAWTVALCASASVRAEAAVSPADATLTIFVDNGGISQWDVVLRTTGNQDSRLARKHPDDYRTWVYAERSGAQRESGSDFQFNGTLEFTHGNHRVRVQPIALKMLPDGRSLALVDTQGRPLLLAETGHRMLPSGDRVEWRNFDLRVQPELARRLASPAISGQYLGALDLVLPLSRAAELNFNTGNSTLPANPQTNCRDTLQWPTPSTPADLALLDISQIFAMRCDGCGPNSADGKVVFAPNAELGNVGQADISWNPKFSAPSPPYGNDQHPFLVWNLYRVDALGRLDQIGSSGVKHAFFAQNNDCSCNGDVILFRTCTDVYSAFTNDSVDDLGPRSEIVPHTAQWGRCGSIYDLNCDGSFDQGSGVAGPYAERLVALESNLLPALNPGSSYFFEAWYVVRDDIDLDNSMGSRPVLPEKNGSAWTLTSQASLTSGPVIDQWVARTATGRNRHAARASTPQGSVQLGARVTQLADGRYRYDYALMNLDFALATTRGAEPNLRILAATGAAGFAIPSRTGSNFGSLEFGDGDPDASNDWSASDDGATLRWLAPINHTLTWGRLFRFALIADTYPELQVSSVLLDPADPRISVEMSMLAPSKDGVFTDGFQ
ncbi:MAG: hypothetical protein ABI411_01955 [Tahibacter sp.]